MVNIGNDWDELLLGEFDKPYYKELRSFLALEYRSHKIYPDMYSIFNALKFTPYNKVKVVILGQDPYHGENQAHGLAFSVQKGIATPKSLINIYKELRDDCGCYIPNNGYLKKWADQGVLLLNTALTVRAGEPNSHKDKGWEIFTDRLIELLNKREDGIVFLLWGANAKTKTALITAPQHHILCAPHPSPLSASRGFFGCRHFSGANTLLASMGKEPVDWQIENI
ncbi:MAG: uracil-DNA glycosylase [Ruminococcaceae bacterium]|nr:uracil-DNA glycosylase [Oscillospiraceae bacterium]